MRDQVSYSYRTKVIIPCTGILIFKCLEAAGDTNGSDRNGNEHFLNLISSQFIHEYYFALFLYFQNVWLLPHFEGFISCVYVMVVSYHCDISFSQG
jgi:hypothetical protein